MAKECTVTLEAPSWMTPSKVRWKLVRSSPGRPTIKSALMLEKPRRWARWKASTTSWAVWRRPMLRSTWSDRDWGLMLMRLMSASRKARSFSWVMVSGRPASTVYSLISVKSKRRSSLVQSSSSCPALRVVGVPPPI